LQDETRLGIPALIHEECCSGYNIGERAGDEVVQLYVKDVVASVTRPVKALQGFRRVRLGADERKTVEFSLAIEDLAFYDRDMNWVVEPGELRKDIIKEIYKIQKLYPNKNTSTRIP
jgi:hypothetical protein